MALTNRFYNLSCALGVARQSADNSYSLPQISMGCRKKTHIICLPALWETHKGIIPDTAHFCKWKEQSFPDKTEMYENSKFTK